MGVMCRHVQTRAAHPHLIQKTYFLSEAVISVSTASRPPLYEFEFK